MKDNTRQAALEAWSQCLDHNTAIDAKINGLLEDIAGNRYSIYEQDDDPIYTIIGSLTASERRKFIKGVEAILQRYLTKSEV